MMLSHLCFGPSTKKCKGIEQRVVFVAFVILLSCTSLVLLLLSWTDNQDSLESMESIRPNQTRANFHPAQTKTRRLPQAIIIGARKSGTRALLKFLAAHPAVRTAQKEIHFFDKPQNYKLGIDWYRKQMPESDPDQLTVEKSPAYFVTKGVPERVKAMNSSIKLILVLREPVVRLISDYSQLVANKLNPSKGQRGAEEEEDYGLAEYGSVELAPALANQPASSAWVAAEKAFEQYVLRPDGGIDDQRRAIKVGMYSMYLERWRTKFGANQFHFVDGEALISDPFAELVKLERFLGLEPKFKRESFVFNPRKGFYCLASNNSAIIRQTRGIDHSGRPPTQQTANLTCLSKSKGRQHVQVRADLIEELKSFYQPYNEYLYSLTGINFNGNQEKILR